MGRRQDKAEVGVRTAQVVDNVDPNDAGRVQILLAKDDAPVWARLATLAAGDGRGTWFLPALGDEVVVAFDSGDPAAPIVVGSLWSGSAAPPESGPARTERTTIRTRSGAVIRIDDGPDAVSPTITIDSGDGNTISLAPSGISVTAAGRVTVTASIVAVEAASVDVNASMTRFSGVVECDTLITTTVVAANYTPGAGNIW